MRVAWLVHSDLPAADRPPLPASPAALLASPIASQRLRVGHPAAFLAAAGHDLALGYTDQADAAIAFRPDLAVFNKVFGAGDLSAAAAAQLGLAQRLKDGGARIMMDLCDNLFADARGELARPLLALCDAVTCNTDAMAEVVERETGKPALVVGDPVEGAMGTARVDATQPGLVARLRGAAPRPLKLLWFAGPLSNFLFLDALLPALAARARTLPLELHVVTQPYPEALQALERHAGGALGLRFTPWTPAVLQAALADCDAVLIPSRTDDPLKYVVSNNRLAQSLWAGRFVLANGMPSYLEFHDCAWLGDDLMQGIDWLVAHPREALARVRKGQERVAARYSSAAIGARWESVLGSLPG